MRWVRNLMTWWTNKHPGANDGRAPAGSNVIPFDPRRRRATKLSRPGSGGPERWPETATGSVLADPRGDVDVASQPGSAELLRFRKTAKEGRWW